MKRNLPCFYSKAVRVLNNHGIVGVPTETVMGLAIVYDDIEAYNRLNILKTRPETKPYSLMCLKEDISKYAEITEQAQILIDKFLPGPLTLLLKAKDNLPKHVTHGSGIVGIRVSSEETITKLLTKLGKPVLAPSANPAGVPPALNSDQVRKMFGKKIDYCLNGESYLNSSSTIIDCSTPNFKIMRNGPIMEDDIKALLGEEVK